MQAIIVFSACLAVASAGLVGPFGFNGVALGSSQYHAQDELGQYNYGYSAGQSSKTETRSADGVTRGAYSYVDGNGLVQNVQYTADAVNGFRVAATNLPVGPAGSPVALAAAPLAAAVVAPVQIGQVQDTYEVQVAKAAHAQAHNEARARAGIFVPAPVQIVGQAPGPVQDTYEVQVAKAAHAQAHNEARARAGIFVPAPVQFFGQAPGPVQDTPEVYAAKVAHAQAHVEAAARAALA